MSGCSVIPDGSILMTATSVASSWPSTVALRVVPSWNLTVIECAPFTTCAAVTMWPSLSTTKPVPLPLSTEMSTTPGAALA